MSADRVGEAKKAVTGHNGQSRGERFQATVRRGMIRLQGHLHAVWPAAIHCRTVRARFPAPRTLAHARRAPAEGHSEVSAHLQGKLSIRAYIPERPDRKRPGRFLLTVVGGYSELVKHVLINLLAT